MSTTIDQQVVEMRFDNQHFEKNVKTSMYTLDKLKQSLNLTGASKGLENVNNAASKNNFGILGQSVEAVRVRFSALQIMGITALQNITNTAVNAGKRIVSALTIDPIKSGFQEYETQINAVQTILANTESKGSTLKDVNKALDELNTYADKTIYNFTEMTRNIGTFTAAGIDLETSTNAIQGIANLAAVSGSTSQQASTAMYQLSQALASGTVKLQDWNSVVNAGMGGQVFQDALKQTARTHGVAVDDMIKKNGSFRESLKEGWITSEILTETLQKMTKTGLAEYLSDLTGVSKENIESAQKAVEANKDGKASYDEIAESMAKTGKISKKEAIDLLKMADTAENAATKVKTFTQLKDTLIEAAQSGWTQTWEILIGDFEEAKTLWTEASDYFGEAINKSAEARNNLLEGWAKGGGRTMAIESIKNAFAGLLSILKPIKAAFREVFPPTTSAQLLKITKNIREFSTHLKLSDESSSKLKATFKGLFTVLKVGIKGFTTIIGAISKLAFNIAGFGNSILDITGNLGEFLTKIGQSALKSDAFGTAVNRLMNYFQNGITKTKEFVKTVTSKLDNSELIDFIGLFNGFIKILGTVGQKITSVGKAIGNMFKDAFRSGDLNTGVSLLNGGIFAAILLSIKNFISGDAIGGLKSVFGDIKDSFSGVKDILNTVRESMEAWQQNLKASVLLKLAGAIAILAGALFLIASIKPERLSGALFGITVMFGELVGAMKLLNGLDGGNAKSMGKTATTLIKMSAAVLILSTALKNISDLSWDELTRGLFGIGILLGELVAVSIVMSNYESKMVKGSFGLILLAVSLKILASVCNDFASMSWTEIGKGLTGVTALLGELVIASLILSKNNAGMVKGSVGLIFLSVALKILASVCNDFASMSWAEIGKGLAGVTALLGELAIASLILSKNNAGMVKGSVGLLLMAGSLAVMESVCEKFASMSWTEIAKGLTGMGLALAELVIALNFMPKNLIGIGAGLLLVSASINIISNALSKLGGMSWEEIGKGLVALGGSMAILAIGLYAMSGTLLGSAALLVAAGALAILTPILVTLGSMSLIEIGKGLLAMAGAFAVIGVAGVLLAPFVPAILALSGAIALFGIGCLAAGAGITLLATGFTALAVALTSNVAAITSSVLILLQGVGDAIVLICQGITNSATAIGEAVVAVVSSLITTLETIIPQIVEFVLKIVDALLNSLAEHMPSIVQAGCDIILALLEGIRNNIGSFVQVATDIIIEFAQAIAENGGRLVQAGIDIIVDLINGLAKGIRENTEAIRSAMLNLCKAMLDAVLIFFGINSPSKVFANVGKNLILGLANGVKNTASSAISALGSLVRNMIQAIGSKVGSFLSKGKDIISNFKSGISSKASDVRASISNIVQNAISTIGSKISSFRAKGSEIMSSLKSGISSKMSAVNSAVKSVVTGALSAIKSKISSFTSIGKDLMNGLKSGISEKVTSIANKAKDAVNAAIRAAKKAGGINSPSKVFAEIGRYMDEGLIVGLKTFSGKVSKAAYNMTNGAVTNGKIAVNKLNDYLNGDIDVQPTIRPVLDLSDVRSGAATIGSMFGSPSVGVMSNFGAISSTMSANNQNGSNDDIVSAINKLRNDLGNLGGNSYTINGITYDNGSAVSEAIETLIRYAQMERRM